MFVPSWRTLLLHCCWPGMGSLLYHLLVQVDISVKAGLALVVLGFARSLLGVSACCDESQEPMITTATVLTSCCLACRCFC
jgi:hypothetical protein